MRKEMALIAAAALLIGCLPTLTLAQNTSNFPPAGASATISKARAKGNLMTKSHSAGPGFKECPSSGVDVGNVTVPRGTRAPREVVTIVEGDVTNVNEANTKSYCK